LEDRRSVGASNFNSGDVRGPILDVCDDEDDDDYAVSLVSIIDYL